MLPEPDVGKGERGDCGKKGNTRKRDLSFLINPLAGREGRGRERGKGKGKTRSSPTKKSFSLYDRSTARGRKKMGRVRGGSDRLPIFSPLLALHIIGRGGKGKWWVPDFITT